MGALRDDPEHVSVPMQGATPPATYDLKPREAQFHGVDSLNLLNGGCNENLFLASYISRGNGCLA